MRISDFKGLFKRSTLTIESVENPYGDYYQVKMKDEQNNSWYPGEHGIFTLPNNIFKGKKWRAFSIASIPQEGVVIIGTRTGKEISNFKKELISMKKGEKVSLRGPFGWFKIQDSTSPIVMIAGGVGITPFRALLKQLEKDTSRPVDLVFSSSDYFLFEKELKTIVDNNRKITLHKAFNKKDTQSMLTALTTKHKRDAFYYISGSEKFISSIKKQIKYKGIKGTRIINDPFKGY